MIIKNIKDTKKFFEALEKCEGRIELVTSEGDRLNLKSKLCQYISLTNIFGNAEIGEIELLFSNTDDVVKVVDFLTRG